MDVKVIALVFFGSILIQASIFGVAADNISEKDREVPKLVKQGNNLEETAAVRALSLKNMILQKRLMKEDIKENRKKRVGGTCHLDDCKSNADCCRYYPNCRWISSGINENVCQD